MDTKKTIVVSAVNLVEAGTLAILRECLAYLSELNRNGQYRIVALVYKRELADFPHIEYIETQWPKKRWINRLWYEYVSMYGISKRLSPVFLWLSLHDTSPCVVAERRAVYCHNSYSFYRWKLHDLVFAPKITLFALFTKYIYKPNIRKNRYLVVQQEWFRKAMAQMFKVDESRIIVAKPGQVSRDIGIHFSLYERYSFIFAGSPNSHKNFEVICKAVELLEQEGMEAFDVYITVSGEENKYSGWLKSRWGKLKRLHFIGFQPKEELLRYYQQCHCLIFPSKVESWGLPISEFATYGKPMLLADLPYAHETAAGAAAVDYFPPASAEELAWRMKRLIEGDCTFLRSQPLREYAEPKADNWEELFKLLLTDRK